MTTGNRPRAAPAAPAAASRLGPGAVRVHGHRQTARMEGPTGGAQPQGAQGGVVGAPAPSARAARQTAQRGISAAKPMPVVPEVPLPETHGGGISRHIEAVMGEAWDHRPQGRQFNGRPKGNLTGQPKAPKPRSVRQTGDMLDA